MRKNLTQLFVPIFLETVLLMLTGTVDTLMLATVSDQAVGAVGTSNTYIGMFIIMFSIISTGMVAVMTQYIGANQAHIAIQAKNVGVIINGILGIVMSVVLFFGSGYVLRGVGIAPALEAYATSYMKIVGAFCLTNALIPIFSGYLRAFGHTKQPMIATSVANGVNVIFNAVFLFGLNMGVEGVAYATVLSRVVNVVLLVFFAIKLIHVEKGEEVIKTRTIMAKILKVGLPSALESALYMVAVTLIMGFLNKMDEHGINVAARSYAAQIINFSYCAGAALAQANAILTGWRIGAGEFEACDRGTKKAAVIGVAVACGLETLFAVAGPLLIGLFTDDPQMIDLVTKILYVDIALEAGRVSNLVFGNALKTSGDAFFTMVIAAIFMYLFGVGGTYLFGVRMEMMAVGAYVGMALDECTRAVCMFIRWQQGMWKRKRLV